MIRTEKRIKNKPKIKYFKTNPYSNPFFPIYLLHPVCQNLGNDHRVTSNIIPLKKKKTSNIIFHKTSIGSFRYKRDISTFNTPRQKNCFERNYMLNCISHIIANYMPSSLLKMKIIIHSWCLISIRSKKGIPYLNICDASIG